MNKLTVNIFDFLHTDTMILAHLLNENSLNENSLNENRKIGLKDLGKEYFGESAAEEAVRMKASVKKNGGSSISGGKASFKEPNT